MTAIDRLRLAQYAYHSCEFTKALTYLAEENASAGVVVLRVKCLYESSLSSAACSEADAHVAECATDGIFHYYRGVAHYHAGTFEQDRGDSLRVALESFAKANALGFGGGQLGLAFVALAEEDFPRALALLDHDLGFAGELEHVRLRVLALAFILNGAWARAEASLLAASDLLKTTPSVLMRHWGDLGWAHLYRVRGQFDLADAVLASMRRQVTREGAPRLFDCLHDESEALKEHDRRTVLQMPVQVQELPVSELRNLGKKRVLNSLFHALMQAGDDGMTRQDLVRQLWDEDYLPRSHDERLHKSINRLRQILEASTAESPPVLTQRGTRYVLAAYRDWKTKYGPPTA